MNNRKHIVFLIPAMVILFIAVGCESFENPLHNRPTQKMILSETKWQLNIVTNLKTNKVYDKLYDKEGNVTAFIEYNEFGLLRSRSDYEYIEKITNEEKSFFSNDGTVSEVQQYQYHYDFEGRVAKKITYDNQGAVKAIEQYSYDSKGNLIKKVETDNEGKLYSEKIYSYSYNNNGNVINRFENLEIGGTYQTRDSMVYAADQMKVERIRFNSTGVINFIYTYYYNSYGLITHEYERLPNGEIFRQFSYEYIFY